MPDEVITARYTEVVVPCDAIPDPTTVAVARAVAQHLRVPVVLHSIVSPGMEALDEFELRRAADEFGEDVDASVTRDDGRPVADQLRDLVSTRRSLLCMYTGARATVLRAIVSSVGEGVALEHRSQLLAIGPRCDACFSGRRLAIATSGADSTADHSWIDDAEGFATSAGLEFELVTIARSGDESVADALISMSAQPDVVAIAMLTRHTGPLNRLGSTTLRVIRSAKCPVLVCAGS